MDDSTPSQSQSQSQGSSQAQSQSAAPPFDEMTVDGDGLRPPYAEWKRWFDGEDPARLTIKGAEAEMLFRRTGITFAVYGQEEAAERLIPFDMVPRVIAADEWAMLERGIAQRVRAINLFLHDIYHEGRCIADGIVPEALIRDNAAFCPPMVGVDPPGGVYTHIVGTDIVRTGEGEFYVLEDNARIPSGVSYMLENRETMMRMFPELFAQAHVRPVEDYPAALRRSLAKVAPPAHRGGRVTVAVLTPGVHNSAYFEHSFLADQMGVPLVESSDLSVHDGRVVMRTTMGFEAVDVLYRRVDDAFLDPLTFDPDSLLGVPGIMDVYRAGGITIANAPGTGIADDKAVYAYMPDIVRYFTGEEAILPNVPHAPLRGPRDPGLGLRAHRRARGEGGARLRRLRDARRSDRHPRGARRLRPGAARQPRGLHRAADAGALHGADPDQGGAVAPARRPAPVRPRLGRGAHDARRPDARGSDRGEPRRELEPGRRHEGHLGAGPMTEQVVLAGDAAPPVGGGALIRSASTGRLRLLGRSASGLTWMMRYIERAETISRLIEAGQRMSLTRQGDAAGEWQAIVAAAGQSETYEATGRPYDAAGVADFLLRDDANPMPLRRMIETARFNARMVRAPPSRARCGRRSTSSTSRWAPCWRTGSRHATCRRR